MIGNLRWLAMPWQGILDHFHKRRGCSHWQRWCPCIKPAMERSKTDWMKAAGKQRLRGTKASLHAYLKFSPMNYISVSIPIFCLISIIFENSIINYYPPDWDLQGDHSLLHTNNLREIDPYSRKVYYLDDPVHLLVSCIEVVTNYELRLEHQVFGAITKDHNFVHQVFGAAPGIVRVWTTDGPSCCSN